MFNPDKKNKRKKRKQVKSVGIGNIGPVFAGYQVDTIDYFFFFRFCRCGSVLMMYFDDTKLQCSENVSRKSCDIKTQLQHHHQLMHPSLSSQGCMVGGADPQQSDTLCFNH